MRDRENYPAGVPCWVDTDQPDPRAAATFYAALFGWELDDRSTASGTYLVGQLAGRDVAGFGTRHEGGSTPAWNTYVAVDDAAAACARAVEAGGRVLVQPHDVSTAGRAAVLADPEGAELRIWQAGDRPGAQAVNEAGTWNWSNLATAQPEPAAAFFGAVFGWRAVELAFGGSTSWMLQLPGYGDFLAERDPELRARHADPSVPAGFSDAIGWLAPDPDATPPAWQVTFAVDDAYGVTDRAVRLGGTVLTPPFDAGVTDIAVLADPEGATFTVSRYKPSGTTGDVPG